MGTCQRVSANTTYSTGRILLCESILVCYDVALTTTGTTLFEFRQWALHNCRRLLGYVVNIESGFCTCPDFVFRRFVCTALTD